MSGDLIAFTPLPPIEGKTTCLHCGKHADVFPLPGLTHPGFGGVHVSRDGETLYPWGEDVQPDEEESRTMQDYENVAAGDPDHDWRVRIDGPMWDGTYQRHGEGQWVLVEQGQGFA